MYFERLVRFFSHQNQLTSSVNYSNLSLSFVRILGVDFFKGTVEEAVEESRKGGLVVAPSGPGLANDLPNSEAYRSSLLESEMVLPDSGLLCLWLKVFGHKNIMRISGLEYLSVFLDSTDLHGSSFWVMPSESEALANISWLEKKYKFSIESASVYLAPIYSPKVFLEDQDLLAQIESGNYKYIFIQLGGGVQERLGLYLRRHLGNGPTIICTGAALAFLSGQQIRIPRWADKYYLGWFLRCVSNPFKFIPRYLSAFRLFWLLFRHGKEPYQAQ